MRWKSIAGAVEEQDEMQRQRGGRSGGEVSNIADKERVAGGRSNEGRQYHYAIHGAQEGRVRCRDAQLLQCVGNRRGAGGAGKGYIGGREVVGDMVEP